MRCLGLFFPLIRQYVDVNKKPDGKSGMDFSETQSSYAQDTERRETNKNTKQKTKQHEPTAKTGMFFWISITMFVLLFCCFDESKLLRNLFNFFLVTFYRLQKWTDLFWRFTKPYWTLLLPCTFTYRKFFIEEKNSTHTSSSLCWKNKYTKEVTKRHKLWSDRQC